MVHKNVVLVWLNAKVSGIMMSKSANDCVKGRAPCTGTHIKCILLLNCTDSGFATNSFTRYSRPGKIPIDAFNASSNSVKPKNKGYPNKRQTDCVQSKAR